MGLDCNGVAFLCWLRDQVSFRHTATLGRQSMYVSEARLAKWLGPAAGPVLTSGGGFCEPFLSWLGAENILSLDASAYEGATMSYDLNKPLSPDTQLRARFTAVIDGGTLEHVFDFPTALRNAAAMVALDGHFLAITPVNGLAGHGFYQFSPELYFRTLTEAWGYKLEHLLLARVGARHWFEVKDPAVLRRRIEFGTMYPAYLYVCARRISIETELRAPHQSDYADEWSGTQRKSSMGHPMLRRVLPASLKHIIRNLSRRYPHRLDHRAFTRFRLRPPFG